LGYQLPGISSRISSFACLEFGCHHHIIPCSSFGSLAGISTHLFMLLEGVIKSKYKQNSRQLDASGF
jgi:hypothetical protein